jgi:RNA polymerase sigma-70 factor (ECF subfamily)
MHLAQAFLAAAPEPTRASLSRHPELERVLASAVESGESAWPTFRIARDAFAAHLGRHYPADAVDLKAALAALRVADLYLACACAMGDSRALEVFEARYFPDIDPALLRETRSTERHGEVAQLLRTRFFVAPPGASPQITLYAGRGDLRNWVRAAIVRTILNLVTRRPKEVSTEEHLLEALPSDEADPELAHMKEVYRTEFRRAFAEAMGALGSEERNLLRYGFVDGLSVDEIGALQGVHRATAARWLAAHAATCSQT